LEKLNHIVIQLINGNDGNDEGNERQIGILKKMEFMN